MSAFIVSDRCMQNVVTAVGNDDNLTAEDRDNEGRALYEMNTRAVNARYPNRKPEEPPPFSWNVAYKGQFDLKKWCQLLVSVQCLLYQCSEGKVPEELAYAHLKDCERDLRNEIVSSLPEYKQASWD